MSNSMVLVRGAIHDGTNTMASYTGSGVVFAHDDISTLILTAGHVCEIPERVMNSARERSKEPSKVKQLLSVVDRQEREYNAMAYVIATEFDACLLQVPLMDIKEIEFSVTPPKLGDKIFNISAPYGHYSKDLAVMFDGYYSGNSGLGGRNVDVYSITAAGGSSGSPLLNSKGEIVGVVSAIRSGFHHMTISPTWEQLKQFITADTVVKAKQFMTHREYAELVGKLMGQKELEGGWDKWPMFEEESEKSEVFQ